MPKGSFRFTPTLVLGALLTCVSALHGAQAATPSAVLPIVNPAYQMKIGHMKCDSDEFMDVKAEGKNEHAILLTWKGRHYLLTRKPTTTGAYHFDDVKAGLVMIQIPAKSMLFDKRNMTRLADDCNPIVAAR